MDRSRDGFYSARQNVACSDEPIRPHLKYKDGMIGTNEEKEDEEEIEMEVEIGRKTKALEEIEKRLKTIKEVQDDLEDESYEEPARLKKLPVIKGPTEKEREEHDRYHVPFRSWCEICVQAKKKNTPHFAVKDKRTYPVISFDYTFYSNKSAVIVMKDTNFGGVWALVVVRKGNGGEYAAIRIADIISKLGYPRVVLKCDQEPAIVDVSKEVRKELWAEMKEIANKVKERHDGDVIVLSDETPVEVIQEHSPVGESSSNGAVERAIQEVSGQVRALKLNIETKANTEIGTSHPIWPWLVEYAAMCIYMYQVGPDGQTARQRTRGRAAMANTVGLGEQVLYKPSKTVKLEKDEARWRKGTWLGVIDHTNEHIIGTAEGVVKCRAIHPREADKKWDVDAMQSIKGFPWKPNPNRKSLRITTKIAKEDECESEEEEGDPDKAPEDAGGEFEMRVDPNEDEERQREAIREAKEREEYETRHPKVFKIYIKKEDVWKYGATPKCAGCKYVLGERKHMEGHSKECKDRMREEMKQDADDARRVEKESHKQAQKKEEEEEKEKVKRKFEEEKQRHRKKNTNRRKSRCAIEQ